MLLVHAVVGDAFELLARDVGASPVLAEQGIVLDRQDDQFGAAVIGDLDRRLALLLTARTVRLVLFNLRATCHRPHGRLKLLSSASRTLRHSGMAEALKTTFEVFTRVGPDNSLERLTERSVGLVTDQPGNVDELFVALFK